ncbi:hypothetical protein BTHE_1995 [Bifidobacterium thermophilum]|nr:hypothetical protein BTHE_1995 [Bifidobacterium thermophilum]
MIRTQLAVPVLDCARQTQDGRASTRRRSTTPAATRRWARDSGNTDEIRTQSPVPAPPHARRPADGNASRTCRRRPTAATREYARISTAPAKYASIRRFLCRRANRNLGIHSYP